MRLLIMFIVLLGSYQLSAATTTSIGECVFQNPYANTKGDVVTLCQSKATGNGLLYIKRRGETQVNVLVDDRVLGYPLVNQAAAAVNVGKKNVYFTTLNPNGNSIIAWKIPLTGGVPEKIAVDGADVVIHVWATSLNPPSYVTLGGKKLSTIFTAVETDDGQELVFMTATGYTGFWRKENDGSFRQVISGLGVNEYATLVHQSRMTAKTALFSAQVLGNNKRLILYNFTTRNLKEVIGVGKLFAGEIVISYQNKNDGSLRYVTAQGSRVATVSEDGVATVVYKTNNDLLDHAINSAGVFVSDGRNITYTDGTKILSVDSTILTFRTGALGAFDCGITLQVTTASGFSQLEQTLPCVLQVPTTEVKVGGAVILYGQNLGSVNDTKIVDADSGTVYTPNLITNDTVVFTAPKIGNRFKVKTNGLTSNTFTVSINSAVVPVIDKITTATGTNGAVAPNGLITVWGQNLSPVVSTPFNYYNPGVTVAARLPLPRLLAGAKVLVNGAEIPLLFGTCYESGSCQFNAQAPSILPGTTATVEVQRYTDVNGFTLEATSQKFTVPVQTVAPVVFSFPKNEETPEISELTVMQNGDKAYQLVTRSTPMKGGQTVVLYSTGFGLTSPEIPVGEAAGSTYAPVTSLVKTWLKYTTGGNEKTEEAKNVAVASPQFPGVNQVNVKLPVVLPDTGTKTFLVVKVGEEYVPDIELPYN